MAGNPWAFDNFIAGGEMYVPSVEDIVRDMEASFRSELEQQTIQHERWKQEIEHQYQYQVDSIKSECLENIRQVKEQHMKDYMFLQQNHQSEIQQLNNTHSSRVSSMQTSSVEREQAIINENNIKLREENNRVQELIKQVEEITKQLETLKGEKIEFQKYKNDTSEQTRILSKKFTESLEKHLEYQDEIAKLITTIDTRGSEIRRLRE